MLSIITAVYNQLAMNELYYDSLMNSTRGNFELIIVDNGSTDGSKEFFEAKPNTVIIENDGNYNYCYCQNRGIDVATGDVLCFFNNDIIVSDSWDIHVREVLDSNPGLQVLSVATNDQLPDPVWLKKMERKWKRIKYPVRAVFGTSKFAHDMMLKLMYGSLSRFQKAHFERFGLQLVEGFSGAAIIMRPEAVDLFGNWDERIQRADFDLYHRVQQVIRKKEGLDPIKMILGVYFHHYSKLTAKSNYPPFANADIMIPLEQKWGAESGVVEMESVEGLG